MEGSPGAGEVKGEEMGRVFQAENQVEPSLWVAGDQWESKGRLLAFGLLCCRIKRRHTNSRILPQKGPKSMKQAYPQKGQESLRISRMANYLLRSFSKDWKR